MDWNEETSWDDENILYLVSDGGRFIQLFFFLLFFDCVACGILVPYPGIELAPPAVEAWRVNHCTTREVCIQLLKLIDLND